MMNRRKLLCILFFVFSAGVSFSLTLPYSKYFPLKPNFHFDLVSDNSNTIHFQTKIEIPDNAINATYVFSVWNMQWNRKNTQVNYSFRFRVSQNGSYYLISMNDGVYNRFFPDKILLFSNGIHYGKTITIGENISFRYLKSFAVLKVGTLRIKNVVKAELNLNSQKIYLYIAPFKGIVAIKSQNDKYLISQN